jgi:hypothetical protein
VTWLALIASAVPTWSAAQTPAPSTQEIEQVCSVAPPTTQDDYSFNAATGTTQGRAKYRKAARPRLIILNKNPFKYEYKVTVAEVTVPEPELGGFLRLLGGPAIDLLPGAEAKPAGGEKPPAAMGKPPVAGGGSRLCIEAFRAIGEGEKDVTARRARADAELAKRKAAYDPVAASVKRAESLFKTNATCSPLYSTAVQLAGDITKYDPKLEEFQEAVAAFSLAIRDQDRRLTAFPESCMQDIGPNRVINEGQQTAAAKLRETVKHLTGEKARFDALLAAMEPILASPTSFTEVRQLGDYDLPTNVKITIERKERVEKATFQPLLTQTLRFGGGQRFTIAGGWYWSTLEKPQYEPVQGFPLDRDGNVIIPEALGPTVGFLERSGSRNGPIAALHTRLWPDTDRWNHLWLTFGITAKNDNEGTNAEYLVGPSVSFAEDRAFVTFGVYGGRVQELQGQLFEGGVIPKELATIPVMKNMHWKFGVAFSWKIR